MKPFKRTIKACVVALENDPNTTNITVDTLTANGVRLVRDHKMYADLCEARDAIVQIAKTLNGSCIDLYPSVHESDVMNTLERFVTEIVAEVDAWRGGRWGGKGRWHD